MTRVRDRIAAGIFIALVIASTVSVTWMLRQTYVVYKLRRGVGDTWFLAANGKPWFRLDEHRRDVPLTQIPKHLRDAFVAVEDHRFYTHLGVDPLALGRAVVRNFSTGSAQGGSTLTQQLARTLFLSNQKTYGRKIREAILALNIDAQLSKDQVLELYLNRIYLSAGVYGVETMSWNLFGRAAKTLSLAESALIAGLARAPSALSPWSNLDGARERSHVVLARMRQEGFITEEQERSARRAQIKIRAYPGARDPRAGYAKEHLRQQFRDRFGGDHPPDWQVQTTFIPELQEAAERAVVEGLARFSDPALQAALVAVDPETGDILALVGGRDFRVSQFNRAIRSRRQPGSAFKPFLFAAALENGYSPVSVINGLANIARQGPDEWAPRNASGDTPDALTIRAALVESNNRAATALQQRMGSRPVLRLASDAGMLDLPDVPSLSLGSGVVTPLDLTAGFAVFPNGGYAVRPRSIVSVINGDGDEALANDVQRERVISEQSAFQMVSMLSDVLDRGTASAARRWGVSFPAGGKTGTTNEFKDAWFVGFTSSMVVGVWVGFDQPKTIGRDAYGSKYALPLWSDFMRRTAQRRRPQAFEPAAGLHEEQLCSVSYQRPVDGCPVYSEYLKEGDESPGRLCTIHQGSMKQRVRRSIEGFFSGFGKKVKGIFR
ncbi:MAG: PBP1A family penicillin-binding protein [Acidobacteriota bacterium]|nr:PBP1A family penicillin-binding protein [Acidobacteriota bacterium]MDQ3418523.1 PBP1A family penicillin-binding protein [Acidobacteriota bacterium]